MILKLFLLLIVLTFYNCHNDVPDYTPNQVHLSIGETNTRDIVVVWVTYNATNESYVEYKHGKVFESKEGTEVPYIFNQRTEFIHKVVLTDLVPNTVYTYHCGSPSYGWSNIFRFKTFPTDEGWGPRLLLFGDLGVGNSRSLTMIQEEIFRNNFPDDIPSVVSSGKQITINDISDVIRLKKRFRDFSNICPPLLFAKFLNGISRSVRFPLTIERGMVANVAQAVRSDPLSPLSRQGSGTDGGIVDAVLHIGDFAYDMNDQDGRVGDAFLNQMEPVAGNVPYITCPGNHENNQNFSQYRNKFAMPNIDDMMFSFNMGPVHFISFSTEYYYFVNYGVWQIKRQYEWLEADLKEATKPENRLKRPWIVTFGHRPMYCSNKNIDDCTKFSSRVRTGIPFLRWWGLEDLFYKYNVDIELWAHEHDYERSWPLYDYKVLNGTLSENPYHEPRAPIHIITGSAGCSEEHDPFTVAPPPWTAFRSLDYGYTRMHIPNKTHIYMEQLSADQGGKIIDNVWIIKEKRLPYQPL